MLTVRHVLDLPVLDGCRLLAGGDGLNKEVNCITVMEVPDIAVWLKGSDILITSLYALKDDVAKQCALVADLARGSCACMMVKLGRYLTELDPMVLRCAEENGFPIIQIPYETYYEDIIMAVGALVYEKRSVDNLVEKYIRDIIFDRQDRKTLQETGKLLGILFEQSWFLLLAIRVESAERAAPGGSETLKNIARKIAVEVQKKNEIGYQAVTSFGNSATILLSDHAKEHLEGRTSHIRQAVSRLSEYHFRGNEYLIGCGTIETGGEAIKRSYFNAVRAMETGRIFKAGERMFSYEDMAFYSVLNDIIGDYAHDLSESVFGRITGSEVADTLVAYYACNASVKETSAKLFVHENTIKYRLQRLREQTGLDVKKQEDSFKLYLAVLADKIRRDRESRA